jgi:hypothetical protein
VLEHFPKQISPQTRMAVLPSANEIGGIGGGRLWS